MLSQFSWFQFFVFIGTATLLWYVYVLLVHFGGSLGRTLASGSRSSGQVAPPPAPVARRPMGGVAAVLQTEVFPQPAPDTVFNAPADSVPTPPASSQMQPVNPEGADDDNGGAMADAPIPGDDLSPAVLAALSGESFNWVDAPALHMDYREPDAAALEELEAIDVQAAGVREAAPEEDEDVSGATPAEDYIATVEALVGASVTTEQQDTVLTALQQSLGNTSIVELTRRNAYAAGNVSWAVEALARCGQLSDAHRRFSERFFGLAPEAAADAATLPAPDDYQALLQSLS